MSQKVTLSNGVQIPSVGMGCAFGDWTGHIDFQGFLPEKAWRATTLALKAGLRHFDLARAYATERHVGDVIGRHFADGSLEREDLFLTTKVAHPVVPPNLVISPLLTWNPRDVEDIYARVITDFERSLLDLGVGYVDLLLMHWPGAFGEPDPVFARAARKEMWRAFETIYSKKQARSIGVCNFTAEHLRQLFEDCNEVRPMVNQIEVHPYCQDRPLLSFCRDNGIVIEAYAPFASGAFGLLQDETIGRIASRVDRSPGQVILRWHIQQGRVVLPKSNSEARMRENCNVFDFELSQEDCAAIDALHPEGTPPRRTCPAPESVL
jgi:diketogulonate reductase-like aldo/keto reductase